MLDDVTILPEFSDLQCAELASELFGLEGDLLRLDGERDLNFLISGARSAVFKISHHDEQRDMLDCQNQVFELLEGDSALDAPRVIRSLNGNGIEKVTSNSGKEHYCRAVEYIHGQLYSSVSHPGQELHHDLGGYLGRLDLALEGFSHSGLERPLLWRMENALEITEKFKPLLREKSKIALVELFQDRFSNRVLPLAENLRRGVIHNDANDNNIVVTQDGPWLQRVKSVIDFGDMVDSWLVVEPAVAAAYAGLGKSHPLDVACEIAAGYHGAMTLDENELRVLFDLAAMRLCMSVCIASYQQSLNPDNPYLSVSEQSAWACLESSLQHIHPDFAEFALRSACGLEPVPRASRVREWLAQSELNPAPVVDIDLGTAPLMVMDTSVGSPHLPAPSAQFDPFVAEREINRALNDNGFAAGIGKYDEYRLIYASDDFVDATGHRRTLHLGIDIFMAAGSAVYTPLAGIVHGVADNDRHLDYGGTVVLSHEVDDAHGPLVFYTLYGHLSPSSIEHLRPGMPVQSGHQVGVMGTPEENGNWAPHVHFEVVTDMLDETGTFVGVGTDVYRDVWLSLCPDPNPLLGIPSGVLGVPVNPGDARSRILHSRSRHLPPSLSLSYRQPLNIVRGDRQYLYDYTGRPYLDAVNNVPHVGHSHPRVTEAIQRQVSVLNTNTRYLYEQIERYSESLLDRFPDSLDTCFLVNSGSEANDLALRLAENFSGRKNRLILDHAYHGNLSSLIEISPYKHNGPGGQGAPDHVFTSRLPDLMRSDRLGEGHGNAEECLATVDACIREADAGGGLALFIAESVSGCGGQVFLPDGYFEQIYQRVRQAGGLCIADEVQVGFGRIGSHFSAFETQGVVPDIVTLGKPIGNGHPLAAVITTGEIATAFKTGMEYFNTFGGNPVSCAAGQAVLDVLEDEDLQLRAKQVGDFFLDKLSSLAENFPVIGQVRGMGLFIGIELVNDIESLSPAPEQASYIVERMCQQGILLSTDGPCHNVIKVKPPMCFNRDNAEFLCDTLAGILKEEFAQPRDG